MPVSRAAVLVGALVGAGLSALVAAEHRDAPLTRWCVVAVIVVAVLAALIAGRGRQRDRSKNWLLSSLRAIARLWQRPNAEAFGAAVWVLFVLAVAAWDGFSFSRQHHDFPTLSHYLGLITEHAWSRGVAFSAWLLWGGWTVFGWRRDRAAIRR